MVYTEIVKIIEGGMKGDQEKVYNYARVLADNLEIEGETGFSKRIRNVLSNKKTGLVALDHFATVPVDSDTRVEMVDVDLPKAYYEDPILKAYVSEEVAEFIQSYERRDELLRAGVTGSHSLLLYGPPGCGKTTLAQYIANKLELPLVTVRLDGLVSSLLGSTAKNLRRIFDYASKRECVLFLDEFDVVAKLRDDKNELGELKRVVNSLIQNIDQFNQENILIAATNHHELLDPAIWRRFSTVITLDKPNHEEIHELIKRYTSNEAIQFNIVDRKVQKIAEAFAGLSHADVKSIINSAIKKAVINRRREVSNWDLLYETYFHHYHRVTSEDHLIRYLLDYGVTQKEISENFGLSLRKVREVAATSKS